MCCVHCAPRNTWRIHTPNQIYMRILVNGEWHTFHNSILTKWRSKYANYFNNTFFFCLSLLCEWSAHLIYALPLPSSNFSTSNSCSSRLRIKIGKFIPMKKLKNILIFSFRFILSQYAWSSFYFWKCLLSSKFSSSSLSSSSSSFSPCFCPMWILLRNFSRYLSLSSCIFFLHNQKSVWSNDEDYKKMLSAWIV